MVYEFTKSTKVSYLFSVIISYTYFSFYLDFSYGFQDAICFHFQRPNKNSVCRQGSAQCIHCTGPTSLDCRQKFAMQYYLSASTQNFVYTYLCEIGCFQLADDLYNYTYPWQFTKVANTFKIKITSFILVHTLGYKHKYYSRLKLRHYEKATKFEKISHLF